MAIIVIFINYCFRTIIKNLTKCNVLNTFAFKVMENKPDIIKKKIMFLVLGHDHSCPWPETPQIE